MTIVITESDFRENVIDYLDTAGNENDTVFITRTNGRNAAVISRERLNSLLKKVAGKESSLGNAIARSQLM
jgi:antitoxin YefM